MTTFLFEKITTYKECLMSHLAWLCVQLSKCDDEKHIVEVFKESICAYCNRDLLM